MYTAEMKNRASEPLAAKRARASAWSSTSWRSAAVVACRSATRSIAASPVRLLLFLKPYPAHSAWPFRFQWAPEWQGVALCCSCDPHPLSLQILQRGI